MKVILREDIADLGPAGKTVDVKAGYGRNYLIPRNMAILATKANLASIGEIQKQKDIRDKKSRREADKVKSAIEKISVSASVKVGEEDKLFGSVTSADIAALMKTEGITVDKRAIVLEEPIKSLGVYTVPVKVDKDIVADLKVWVIKEG